MKGPIGSTFADEDLSELEVVGFSKIPNPDFPVVAEEDGYELSKDQDFLLKISLAIISGEMPPGLADQETGKLVWSRWVTLANAYFRKYVSTLRPSRKFQELTHAGVTFYAPSWFQIKTHPKCTDGPKNLMAMIKFSRKLSKKLQELVQEVLQRNAYFAHPEAILLAMLADDDADIRARAVNQILTIRMKALDPCDQSNEEDVDDGRGVDDLDENEEDDDDGDCLQLEPSEIAAISSSKVRKYILPKINFKAYTYTELIDWETSQLSEPPFTLTLTNEQMTSLKDSPLDVLAYPCHTQAVERAIRLVSEASSSVIGHEAREGFIRQGIQARKGLKGHASKKDFFARLEGNTDE